MIHPLPGPSGRFGADAVTAAVRGGDIHSPRSRMLVVENTHNRAGGTVWTLDAFSEVAIAAKAKGLAVHVDGARLWNACVAGGYRPAEFAAAADSVSVCFSKGLGAPVGSALCGPADLIRRARRFRKMFGGGMRQSGLLAAACIHAIDHHRDRLADDHAHARRLATALARIDGLRLDPAPDRIETNMVFFELDARFGGAARFCESLAKRGVRMIPMGANRVRAVTHLDVDAGDIDRAAATVAEFAAAARGAA
jgi:threonine aldolase